MPVRLVITTYAKPGKGAELAQAMADRCRAVQQEPGCQQFKVFQSALDPDTLVTLELWDDQAALDAHAQVNATRPPNPALRSSALTSPDLAKTTRTTARGSPACAGPPALCHRARGDAGCWRSSGVCALLNHALGFSAHRTTSWSMKRWASRFAWTRRKKLRCLCRSAPPSTVHGASRAVSMV